MPSPQQPPTHRAAGNVFRDVQQVQLGAEVAGQLAGIFDGGVGRLAEISGDDNGFEPNHMSLA